MEVKMLGSVEEFNRRQLVRNLIGGRILNDGPLTQEKIEAFKDLVVEALLEKEQLPQLSIPKSKMIH